MNDAICPPGLRIRDGNWHYRVKHQGREWAGNTGLVATKRNVSAALSVLAKAREAVRNGQADRLSLEVRKFDEAAEEFLSGLQLIGRWKTYYAQPRSFSARPAFHILVMWAILSPSNCIT
jgi:hypothetical protein